MHSPLAEQRENFCWHLDLAREIDKPVIVHCRDAHEATVELLRSVPGVRGVMHCYSMGPRELPAYLELGFFISFSGVVTYPKNQENREAARLVPADRILFETDSPFLAPQGQRGRRNEPAFVRAVVEAVAEVRGEDPTSLGETASRNAAALFGLPPP
jgi:TatD DNase family protein